MDIDLHRSFRLTPHATLRVRQGSAYMGLGLSLSLSALGQLCGAL